MSMFSCRGLIEMFTFGPSIYAVFAFNRRDIGRPRESATRELYVRVAAGIGKESSRNSALCWDQGLSLLVQCYGQWPSNPKVSSKVCAGCSGTSGNYKYFAIRALRLTVPRW